MQLHRGLWLLLPGKPGPDFKSCFLSLTGQDVFSLGLQSPGSLRVQDYTPPLLLFSFPGAVKSKCDCQEKNPEKPEPQRAALPAAATHTHRKPKGS